MLKVCFYSDIQMHVDDLSKEVAMKDILEINEPNGYKTLQESLKIKRNYRALVKLIN